jgi:hypothetical protein
MTLYSIRLELARTKEFPDGSSGHGYEFVAPLGKDGHLDAVAWRDAKARCTVRRFQTGAADEHGTLVHAGKGWHFDYLKHARDDDEPLFKLDRHLIKEGEYLSVTEHDGIIRPFRIVSVRALA